MREELMTVLRTKAIVGQLRAGKIVTGRIEPPVFNAREVSEYFLRCLVPYLRDGTLQAGNLTECNITVISL